MSDILEISVEINGKEVVLKPVQLKARRFISKNKIDKIYWMYLCGHKLPRKLKKKYTRKLKKHETIQGKHNTCK